jgi:4-hydroxybenzoate polyprenyltransferase
MSDSSTDIRPMTDSEFDEWTDVRSRGISYMRRKCFIISSVIAAITIAILAAVKYTEITPVWVRLMLPIDLIFCMIMLPFLLHFFFTPLLWKINEQRYAQTLEIRATKKSNDQ